MRETEREKRARGSEKERMKTFYNQSKHKTLVTLQTSMTNEPEHDLHSYNNKKKKEHLNINSFGHRFFFLTITHQSGESVLPVLQLAPSGQHQTA